MNTEHDTQGRLVALPGHPLTPEELMKVASSTLGTMPVRRDVDNGVFDHDIPAFVLIGDGLQSAAIYGDNGWSTRCYTTDGIDLEKAEKVRDSLAKQLDIEVNSE
jgi:hypothetical protein